MGLSPQGRICTPIPFAVLSRFALAGVVWLVAALIWCDALAPGSPILRPLSQAVAGVVRH